MAYTRTIGAVFGQRTQLWWDIAVVESFRLLQQIYEVSESDYKARMQRFDEILELGRYLHQPVRKLSLGERMRCDMAAALLHNPPLVFLDEPTIGLDLLAKESIRQFLGEINRELGTTMLLTTHDLADIEALCKRLMIIDHGRVLFDGQLDELKAHALAPNPDPLRTQRHGPRARRSRRSTYRRTWALQERMDDLTLQALLRPRRLLVRRSDPACRRQDRRPRHRH